MTETHFIYLPDRKALLTLTQNKIQEAQLCQRHLRKLIIPFPEDHQHLQFDKIDQQIEQKI